MRKGWTALLALVLSLALCTGALADVTFVYEGYMGYQGEETTIRLSSDGKDAGKPLQLRDQEGCVLIETTVISGKGKWNVSFVIPEGTPGIMMSVYVDGAEEADDTVLLAAETRPGYSITRVDRDDKKIAITFDAANSASKTSEILDVLDKYGAKCTFFVIGRYIVNNPELVQEIEARGHELGGHSWDHKEMPSLTNEEIIKDFARISAEFEKVLGHDVVLYRPPSGYSSQRDRAIGRALGQEVIKWTIDSRDGFSDTTLNTVIKRVQNNAKSGDIILMHVYGKHTIAALETLLPWYIEQEYEFVTVSELLLEGDTYIDTDGVQHLAAETAP